jgi:hypothetical protein
MRPYGFLLFLLKPPEAAEQEKGVVEHLKKTGWPPMPLFTLNCSSKIIITK